MGKPYQTPNTAKILSGTLPALVLDSDGYAQPAETRIEKLHPNMPRYSGREFVVAIDPNADAVTGTVTCSLHNTLSGESITTGTATIEEFTPPSGSGLALGTTSPVAGHANEIIDTSTATQRFLVKLPTTLPAGSYWLVVYEDGEPIGTIHIHLADVEPPEFDEAAVLTAAVNGTQITQTSGSIQLQRWHTGHNLHAERCV
jgi:hypothetical protein